MLELSDKIHTVFFTLGFACNFKCKYCLQFSIKEKYEPDKWYNTDIIKFIKIIADKRKKSGQ